MNNIHSIAARRQLKEDSIKLDDEILHLACSWVTKIDRRLSSKEKKSLQQWISSNPQNMKALLEVAHMWDKMNKLNRLADLFPQNYLTGSPKKFSKKWAAAVAASIFMIFSSSLYFSSIQKNTDSEQYVTSKNFNQIFQTNVGESRTQILSDGSKIVFNTNTIAHIRFSDKARIIELEQGEIHIDVALNKYRPLSFIVAGKIIQAVGTAFNVEVRNNSIELLVTDGKVLVAPIDEKFKLEEIKNYKLDPVEHLIAISKGEKIELLLPQSDFNIPRQEIVIKIAPIEIAANLSWRTGNLIFRGEPLVDAMAEISRYNDITIELDDNDVLKNIRVAGMFRTGDIEGLLNVLEKSFNIHHTKLKDNKILLSLAGNTNS